MKSSKWLALVLAAIMALSLCAPALAEDTIKIGGLAPLTGPYAVYGNAVKNGADLYIAQLNANGGIDGKKVELLWEDHEADDTQAQKVYFNYLDDGCAAILGDVLTGQCRVVASLAMDDGIPMVTASGTAFDITEGKPNVFRTCCIDDFQGTVMANFAFEQGYKKVAILYGADSAYSVGLVAAFEAQAAINGVEIVAKEAANFTDIDFKSQLTNIKNAAPDAVFLPFYGAEASLILTQAQEVGLSTIYMGADGISDIVPQIADKSLLTQITYADHFAFDSDDEAVVKFIADYTAMFGEEPTVSFSATGYDAALVICEAIKAAGTTDFEAVATALKNIETVGVSGVITFDANNNPIKSAFVMTFDAEGGKHFVAKVDP
ncbi:MAG: ABC transporter substrate-binding protein [Clostridia bacterium]|nr:ABC transporter substrate-binding protein [Clostridia bacterium]